MYIPDEKRKAAELAADYFGNGYHCAEAVVAAVLETMGEESSVAVKYATAFGGGFGESFKETCGIVSGSLIAIGHYYGKDEQGANWKDAARLGREVTKTFTSLYGTCNCGKLRDRFGEEKQMDFCRKIVAQGAETLILTLTGEKFEKSDQHEECKECAKC